jgi:phosphoenolpyruvate phosphomutase
MNDHSHGTAGRSSLRQQIGGTRTLVVAGAYDALSARLVEEAGFDGIWLSGLGASVATKALPDLSLVTQTEMLDIARNMTTVVGLPLIVDCDSGFGDSNNVRYAVDQFERVGAQAMCVEDNEYPKRNSFYSVSRKLVTCSAMTEKIKAGVQARQSTDFLFIARTEALIANLGMEEALGRARAYEDAGADALVIHSRTWSELSLFAELWRGTVPLVAIPTAFPEVSVRQLQEAGFRVAIFANQALRAAARSMQTVLKELRRELRGCAIEDQLASLEEMEQIVRLQDWIPTLRSASNFVA